MQILIDDKPFIRGQSHGEVPEKFRLNGRYLLHEYALLEADTVSLVHRKNARTHIRFMVSRQHASQEAASEFILRNILEIPPKLCTVAFVLEDPKAYGLRFELTQAGLRSSGAWTEQAQSWIEYEVIGGTINPK